ncbi:unnamed protein product [Closterium sp. NIES-54]
MGSDSDSQVKEELAAAEILKNASGRFATAANILDRISGGFRGSQQSSPPSHTGSRERQEMRPRWGSIGLGARGCEDPASTGSPAKDNRYAAVCGDESGSSSAAGFGRQGTIRSSLTDDLKTVTDELNAILHSAPDQRDAIDKTGFTNPRSCFNEGNREMVTKQLQSQHQMMQFQQHQQQQQQQQHQQRYVQQEQRQQLGELAKSYYLLGNSYREAHENRTLLVRAPAKHNREEDGNCNAETRKRTRWTGALDEATYTADESDPTAKPTDGAAKSAPTAEPACPCTSGATTQ